jgi:hypothetical protein
MPLYLNSTTAVITVGNSRIEPGQILSTTSWFATLPVGVTKTSDLPYGNTPISSGSYTASGTLTIPATTLGNYSVTVYADTGEVTVKFNSAFNTPYYIAQGLGLVITCLNRTVNDIRYTVITGGKVYITVEPI